MWWHLIRAWTWEFLKICWCCRKWNLWLFNRDDSPNKSGLWESLGLLLFKLYVKLRCRPHVHGYYLLSILMLVKDQTGPYQEPNQVIILSQGLLPSNPVKHIQALFIVSAWVLVFTYNSPSKRMYYCNNEPRLLCVIYYHFLNRDFQIIRWNLWKPQVLGSTTIAWGRNKIMINYIKYSKIMINYIKYNKYRSCPFKQSLLVVSHKLYQNQDGF